MERERFGSPSEDHQPITWLRGYPIYATHLIVLVYVVSMIVTSILLGVMGQPSARQIAAWMMFDTSAVFNWQLWRYFTYGLWNEPTLTPFTWDMLFLFMFGREVEKFFGRLTFLRLFACLYFITPLLFTLLGKWRPMNLVGETGAFAVFIAFATLYPDVELMFNVMAKWAAFILFGVFTLIALAYQDLNGFLALWVTVLFAHGFVRYHQGRFNLPKMSFGHRKPKLRVLPDLEAERGGARTSKDDSMAEVDALLDKIAQSGISSLTAKERAKLDRARDDLKNRGSRHT
jgi:hypothetical protein